MKLVITAKNVVISDNARLLEIPFKSSYYEFPIDSVDPKLLGTTREEDIRREKGLCRAFEQNIVKVKGVPFITVWKKSEGMFREGYGYIRVSSDPFPSVKLVD